ncbi:NmrA family transcriptional regulator [Aspergillus caelatus]|uniref:NmrA family transcriptional regulator n=1 Tax=Aspergillus caelatus TaxID=61420 RepID=A0A5N6ZXE2_9EURO|nr:NmrA family transcriptional regulator [Aspergillus caelatus]KAE8362192.1 NmrA family transcriptional regulator [Aspergillus caelatus]
MKKTLVVFGATGNQGGSVIDYVLNDIELSNRYHVRAVTRNPDSAAAVKLKGRGVEVVQGNMDHPGTIERVLHNANIAFILTTYQTTKVREVAQGKAIADAAVAKNLEFIIYSTLPSVIDISDGKYRAVEYFDSKAETEKYIRALPIKAAFFAPGCYMQNFHDEMKPRALDDGTYELVNSVHPHTQLPLIDIADSGKFVGAILADPDRFQGQLLSAATEMYSFEEIVGILSESTGKRIKFLQVTENSFRESLPPDFVESLLETMRYFEEYGYYGPRTKENVEATAKVARGRLTTLQEYLHKEPIEYMKTITLSLLLVPGYLTFH